VMFACNVAASEMAHLESMVVEMQRLLANSLQDPATDRALANLHAAQDTLTRWRSIGHTPL
jgi:anti-sigma factor RsiW